MGRLALLVAISFTVGCGQGGSLFGGNTTGTTTSSGGAGGSGGSASTGDPTATTPGAPWIVLASGSWFVRRSLTLTASSGLRGTGPGFVKGRAAGQGTVAPWASAGAAVKLGPGRLTVGVSSSVPLPGLGASEEARVALNLGYTLVSKRRPGVR